MPQFDGSMNDVSLGQKGRDGITRKKRKRYSEGGRMLREAEVSSVRSWRDRSGKGNRFPDVGPCSVLWAVSGKKAGLAPIFAEIPLFREMEDLMDGPGPWWIPPETWHVRGPVPMRPS